MTKHIWSVVAILWPISTHGATITLEQSGRAVAEQTGIYEVRRDLFNNGGHGWVSRSPNPYNDGYSYGDLSLNFALNDLIPEGSTVHSATLSYSFSNHGAVSDGMRVDEDTPNGGPPYAPRVHGSSYLCNSPEGQAVDCYPARLNSWEPESAFWASRITSSGVHYWFPANIHRNPSGTVDLLEIWSAEQLESGISFVGTVQYALGRPLFEDEGDNADTQFRVKGHGRVDVTALLSIDYTPAEPPPPASTPEPSTLALFVSAAISVVGYRWQHLRPSA